MKNHLTAALWTMSAVTACTGNDPAANAPLTAEAAAATDIAHYGAMVDSSAKDPALASFRREFNSIKAQSYMAHQATSTVAGEHPRKEMVQVVLTRKSNADDTLAVMFFRNMIDSAGHQQECTTGILLLNPDKHSGRSLGKTDNMNFPGRRLITSSGYVYSPRDSL